MPRLSPGDKIERYTVVRPIGEGGMGEVYEARDERLQRSVALKVLRLDDAGGSTGNDARLLREARLVATLVHPNVVAVYDVGETRARSRSHGPCTSPWSSSPGVRSAATSATPRCPSPGGSAGSPTWHVRSGRRTPTLSSTTMEGVALGTPYYMAPAQMRGERLDGRADQFSWGVVAYELLTGKPPWTRGASGMQLATEILSRDPTVVTAVESRTPTAVGVAVMRAFAKSPAMRFPTMDLLLASLEGAPGADARVTESDRQPSTDTSMAKTVPSSPHGAVDSGASIADVASADTMLDTSRKSAPAVATGDVLGGRYRILGEVGARRFGLSMELVEGEPLDVRIERAGPLPAGDLVAMANDLAAALAAAHGAGVTHRDLKPGNVILRAGGAGAVITDFGIARLHQAADATSVRAPRHRRAWRPVGGALAGRRSCRLPRR